MIQLKDVSTERFIAFSEYYIKDVEEIRRAYLTLTRHKIRDFQTLKNMVVNGRREFNNEYLKNAINEVEENIKYANDLGREPVLFTCNNYENSSIYRSALKLTDRENTCEILLCKSPAITTTGKYDSIKDIKIGEAKDLLGKVVGHDKKTTGLNAFTAKIRRIGNNEAECVRNAINFYEEQVLRQAMETKKRNVNLFLLNKLQKEFIVREQIKAIVNYLVDNADVCVWGELSPAQKTRLVSAVTKYSGYENQLIRERMIECIANYTTLSELEAGVVKQKTLDRFIIK